MGLYLLQVGSHLRGRPETVSYVAGAAILVVAVFSGRPLGGGPVPRPLHRLVDIAVVAGLATAPFLFGLSGEVSAVLRLESVAAAWAAVVWLTNYAPRPPRRPAGSTARVLREQGPRLAGQLVGRHLGAKRRPPDPPSHPPSRPPGPVGGA